MSLFAYHDVSVDPAAREASRLPPEILAEARAARFDELGWIATHAEGRFAFVSHVAASPDGTASLALTWSDEAVVASFASLLEDGTVVSTDHRLAPWSANFRAGCHGVARRMRDPAHKYLFEGDADATLPSAWARHRARVEALRGAHGDPVPVDLGVYAAVRRRAREISDPDSHALVALRDGVAWRVGFGGTTVGLALGVGVASWLAPLVRARYGAEVGSLVWPAVVVASVVAGFAVALFVVAEPVLHALDRRRAVDARPVPRARDARGLVEDLGQPFPGARVPESDKVAEPLPLDARGRASVSAYGATAVALAIVAPALGLAANLAWGVAGGALAAATMLGLDAGLRVAGGGGVERLVLARVAPELAAAERRARSPGDRELASTVTLLESVGAAVAFGYGAHELWGTGERSPVENVFVVWASLALALLSWATIRSARLRARVVAAEEPEAPSRSADPYR